jgi:MFS family permease
MGEEALIPLRFFRNRTFSLSSIGGFIIGMGMFGGLAVLPLYLQIVRGASPTESGLQLLPLTFGLMLGSITSGQLISRTGRYKVYPVIGSLLATIGLYLLHTIGVSTPFWRTGVFMAVLGLGLGFILQPITLAVQNAMSPREIGVATSSATFFRQMGATAGTALFLSLLFTTVGGRIQDAFRSAGPAFQQALANPAIANDPVNRPIIQAARGGLDSGALNDTSFLNHINPVLALPFKVGFSSSMDMIFMVAAAILLVAFVIFVFLPQVPLRTQSGLSARAAEEELLAQRSCPAAEPAGSLTEDGHVNGTAGRHAAATTELAVHQGDFEGGHHRASD